MWSQVLVPGSGFLEAGERIPRVFRLILRLREKQALESHPGTGNVEVLMLSYMLFNNPSITQRQTLVLLAPLPLTECGNCKDPFGYIQRAFSYILGSFVEAALLA